MKKTYLICASVSAMILCLTGCNTDEPVRAIPVLTPIGEMLLSVPAEGGDYSISYTLENPVESGRIQVECTGNDDDWISNINDKTVGTVSLTIEPNTDTTSRNATVTVYYIYPNADPLYFDTTIEQKGSNKKEEYKITISVSGEGSAHADKETATEGETVTLTASADEGYIFNGWNVTDGDIEIQNPDSESASFIMSSSNVNILAEFISSEFNIFNIIDDNAFKSYVEDRMLIEQTIDDVTYPAWDSDNDGKLSKEELAAVEAIDIESGYNWEYISSLKGIEYFTGLRILKAGDNTLNGLDISSNTKLEILDISYNTGITTIDVSKNTELKEFDCEETGLTSIDITSNNQLEKLTIGYNNINKLDLSNNSNLIYLNCNGCSVSDLNLSDNTLLQTLYISSTNITSIDLSENLNLKEFYCIRGNLKSLNAGNLPKLEKIYCYIGCLEDINISNTPSLKFLECNDNNLKSLDVISSGSTVIESIYCHNNQITDIKLGNNQALKRFKGANNQLTSLDFSNSPALVSIECENNSLKELIIGDNPSLYNLSCYNNELTALDISGTEVLEELYCYDNRMSTLDATAMSYIYSLQCGRQTSDGNQSQILTLKLQDSLKSQWEESLILYETNSGVVLAE